MKRPSDKTPRRSEPDRGRPDAGDSASRKPPLAERARDPNRKASADKLRAPRKAVAAAPASAAATRPRNGRRSRADGSESDEPDIGFKKPPKSYSWKKGQSGNPKGRKKGSRNRKTVIISLMEGRLGRKIPDPRKLTAQEGMLWKAIQKGLAGDAKAMAFAFKRYDDATANSWTGTVITTEEDQQVYDALRAKIRREFEDEQ